MTSLLVVGGRGCALRHARAMVHGAEHIFSRVDFLVPVTMSRRPLTGPGVFRRPWGESGLDRLLLCLDATRPDAVFAFSEGGALMHHLLARGMFAPRRVVLWSTRADKKLAFAPVPPTTRVLVAHDPDDPVVPYNERPRPPVGTQMKHDLGHSLPTTGRELRIAFEWLDYP